MIDTKELRIGNYIGYYSYNENDITIDKIKSIYFDDTTQIYMVELASGKYAHSNISLQGLKPILLTDEILRDWCGFNYCVGIFSHKKIWSVLFIQAYHNGPFLLKTNAGDPILLIKNLHQLQNLYFALTGEELQIKIPFS